MKVIKVQKHLVIVLSNGDTITENNCTDEMYNDIIAHQDDEQYVRNLLTPKLEEKKVEIEKVKEIGTTFDTGTTVRFKPSNKIFRQTEFKITTNFSKL